MSDPRNRLGTIVLAGCASARAGCASSGQWRALAIDGSSEAAFEQSLMLLDQEMPWTQRQILALALVDIASTEARSRGSSDAAEGDRAAAVAAMRPRTPA